MNKESYLKYLESYNWQKLRAKVLARDYNKCRICNRIGYTVHHITYKRIGHEDIADLLTVCFLCHTKLHNKTITQEQLKLYAIPATNDQLNKWSNKKNVRAIKHAIRKVKSFKRKFPNLKVPEALQQIQLVERQVRPSGNNGTLKDIFG